jgi:putative transposase
MARPLRIEYKDAMYYNMSRGLNREDVFLDEGERCLLLSSPAETVNLFCIKIYSYCLMSNHYHLLVGTPNANIPRATRHINGPSKGGE